jgi:hypothetical protein
VHLDLHVDDREPRTKRRSRSAPDCSNPTPDFDAAEGHQVYADPAGHPFCIGWGHPSREAIAAFVVDRLGKERSQGA